MTAADSSFRKGASKYLTADKTDFKLSPSRIQPQTISKSQFVLSGTSNDEKKTIHKRSLNFCKH